MGGPLVKGLVIYQSAFPSAYKIECKEHKFCTHQLINNYCFTDGHIRGISSYTNPELAGQSLQSCIESKAKKLIPSYVQEKSPIYLGATAGMRLLK